MGFKESFALLGLRVSWRQHLGRVKLIRSVKIYDLIIYKCGIVKNLVKNFAG